MSDEWEKIVNPYVGVIVNQLKPGPILIKLLQKRIIKDEEFRRLQKLIDSKSEEDCNRELLTTVLNKRGPNSVKEFVELLKDTNQQHVADLLSQTQVEPHAEDKTKGLMSENSRIFQAVLKCGVVQWFSIGLAVGLTADRIEACTFDKPSPSSKLEAIIELLRRKRGVKEAEKALLVACEKIPVPITGAVLDFIQERKQSSEEGSVAALSFDHMSPEGRRLYDEACKKGKVRINHVLIDILGEEDAGKSCLGDSIMDNPYNPEKPSTKGVKFTTVIKRASVTENEWKEMTDQERNDVINRFFAKEYVSRRKGNKADLQAQVDRFKEESATAVTTSTRPTIKEENNSLSLPTEEDVSLSTTGFDEIRDAVVLTNEIAEVISLMEEKEEEMRKCDDMVVITVMDRGGQDQYLSIHAALMADTAYCTSVCLLVFDGTKSLDQTVTHSEFRLASGGVARRKRDVTTTRAQLIRNWASAMDASRPYDADLPPMYLGMKYVKRPPATFIVATRKDKTDGKGETVKDQESIIKSIIAEEKFGDHTVPAQADPYMYLFHVDNTRSGTGNPDPSVVKIKGMIIEMTYDFWKNQPPIPLPWAMLDKILSLLAMRNYRVLAFRDVCYMARKSCYIETDQECQQALRYLCSLGTVCFYYNIPGLSDKIFPDTQWVADVLSVFVTVLDKDYVKSDLWRHLETLQNKGLMRWDLAKYLMQTAGVKEANYSCILHLLQLFNVISPPLGVAAADDIVLPWQDFFVPCMVTREYINKENPAYRSALSSPCDPPPLFLVPKGCSAFLKPLFYRLVSRMVTKYECNPELSRNQVVIHLPDDLELEMMYNTEAVIATVYAFDRDEKPSDEIIRRHCIKVRVHLTQDLTLAKRRGMDGFEFELCVHPPTRPDREDDMYTELACLDDYPRKSTLSNRITNQSIKRPKQLCLWYPNEKVSNAIEIVSSHGGVWSFEAVEKCVVKHGQEQWYSFGLALGLTDAEIESKCEGKPTHASKLQAIIRRRVQDVGEWRTRTELLDACKHLPTPICGIVLEDLQKVDSSRLSVEDH